MKRRASEALTSREPAPLSPYETAILAAELGQSVPTIDLHGDSAYDAIYRLGNFIYSNHPLGTDVLKIVHGKGTQKLHHTIHKWLKSQKGVLYFGDAEAPGQQGGVTYIVIK